LSFNPFKLPKVLSVWEKRLILFLILVVVICAAFLYRRHLVENTKFVPAAGGTYIEGFLPQSKDTLDEIAGSLTQIGLTRIETDGSIRPAIAKEWHVSEDGKIYTFTLHDQYSAPDIAQYIKKQKGSWSEIAVSTPNNNQIVFTLKQPYGLFIGSTIKPIFPYGPYKLEAQTGTDVIFTPNTNKPLQKPYFEKIILRTYPDQISLQNALKRGKISGTAENITGSFNHYKNYAMEMPRYNVAFFNAAKAPLNDKNIRQQFVEGTPLPQPLRITLYRSNATSAKEFSDELISKWSKQNIEIEVKNFNSPLLLTEEAKKGQYDILIYGINSGYYDDLYPYWHSSQQLPQGTNFTGVKDMSLDRLLEEARLTQDNALRWKNYHEAKTIVTSEYLAVFQNRKSLQFFEHKNIKGIFVKYAVSPLDRFTFFDKWYINTRRVAK
jgi:ABC-type transport system substrate-binding protein